MSFQENRSGELVYMTSDRIRAHHLFTTRFGGVSTGIWSSLNLGSGRGDDPAAVKENYRRLTEFMGVGIDECVCTKQVHSADVRIVTKADRHVYGVTIPFLADGIVTAERGLPIFCFSADCIPVLLCDRENGVIGAVHCGWRGSVNDILGNAIAQMLSLGAKKETICAAQGPAIGKCCFETDDDVPEAVERYLSGDTEGLFVRRSDGKTLVDLRGANTRRLLQLGLRAENLDESQECTFCLHDKYWSHRYTKGNRGVQGAGIVL